MLGVMVEEAILRMNLFKPWKVSSLGERCVSMHIYWYGLLIDWLNVNVMNMNNI